MDVKTTTLPNGLRVVTETMPHLKTAALGIYIGAGARWEEERNNGVAHMLEHMAFKGTERRSARAIAEEIEAVGGHLNAWTAREQTAYHARILQEDVPLAIDMIADILQHSTFAPDELERERGVILQEIGQTNDTPDDLVFDLLQEAAWPDQPLGRSILGTEERVQGMSRADLSEFMSRHYHAPDMVLAAAGGIEHDAIVELAEKHFSSLSRDRTPPHAASAYAGGERRDVRELDQAHIALAWPGIPFGDPDIYAAQIYSTLLGGGMSSRLFQEVREKRGLAYSVFAFTTAYEDNGLLTVYAGTGEDQYDELIPVIAEQMHATAKSVGADEIARARAQIKAGLLMSLESPSARIDQFGRQLFVHGRVLDTDEMLARIAAVDDAAVRRVAARYLAGTPTLSAIGPVAALADYDRIAAQFRP